MNSAFCLQPSAFAWLVVKNLMSNCVKIKYNFRHQTSDFRLRMTSAFCPQPSAFVKPSAFKLQPSHGSALSPQPSLSFLWDIKIKILEFSKAASKREQC